MNMMYLILATSILWSGTLKSVLLTWTRLFSSCASCSIRQLSTSVAGGSSRGENFSFSHAFCNREGKMNKVIHKEGDCLINLWR